MIGSSILPKARARQFRTLAGISILSFILPTTNGESNRFEFPQYVSDTWDVSRGYPGGQIYGITQTSDGYLWVGTDRGLVRFDGSVFQVFRQVLPAKTPVDSVYALAGDSQGNLLISTRSGLQRLRLRNEELVELPRLTGQPEDPLVGIYQEHKGTILIGTVRRGLVAYDGKSFTPLVGTPADITAAIQARDGTIWMGTATQGLFAHANPRLLVQPKDLHHVRINALLRFGQHGIRVGTDKGLLQWDGTSEPSPLFGPPHIVVMLEDRQGTLWLGSKQGLYLKGSPADGVEENTARSISPYSRDMVTSLYEDREGDVWAGTSAGLMRCRRRSLISFPLHSETGGVSGPLFADDQGSVWCAEPKLGLMRIVDGRAERIFDKGDYTALAAAGTDLWLGQKDGALLRVKLPTHTATKEAQFGQPIIAIFRSREGPLWVGLLNSGAAQIVQGKPTMYSNVDGLVLNTVTAIEQSNDGAMWFATANGLASLSQGKWNSFTARNGMPPGRINCLLADGSGMLWVGADQGLAFVENGKVHLPEANLPLLREPILGIAIDHRDFLWILTSSHLFRVKRTELFKTGSGSILVQQFGLDDGLPTVAPSRNGRSIATDAMGRIWMSLGNGLVIADPAGLSQPSPPTLVQFQQVSADEIPLALSEPVSVPAGHVRTIIRFTGLNLAAPDRVRFRYRLEGLDPDWSPPTSVREASYTNLNPGPYRLEVQASNIDGLWNGPPAGIALYLEPAPWQTLWFRSLIVLSICAMGFAAYHLKLRAMKRQWNLRFQARLDERTRIARDLHDTLLQSFHGLIMRFQAARNILPDDPQAASDALDSAIDRAAEAITEGRDAVQALRGEEEYDDLGDSLATIDREFLNERPGSQQSESDPRYRVLVEGSPRRLHPLVRDDLHRIAREALRNAFRHAQAKNIELDIRYDDVGFRLRVRDDGTGIDPQVLTVGRRKGHYGLPGMRERAISIGGQFEIWSELRRGTEIEVVIPGMIAYVQFENPENDGLY